jgi:hypothetical protein
LNPGDFIKAYQEIFNWLLFTLLVTLCCGYKPLELFVTSGLPAAEHLRQWAMLLK